MKVLIDTSVVLDVILNRQPFRESSSQVPAMAERGEMVRVLGATTLTTLFYLIAKVSGKDAARSVIRDLIGLFEIAAVDREILKNTVDSDLADFEDAVLCEVGTACDVDAIVTRDPAGFEAVAFRSFHRPSSRKP